MIPWIGLQKADQLEEIESLSSQVPVLIFKHSTRCSISSMAKLRLESDWDFSEKEIQCFFLDLIKYRNLSNLIAEKYSVHHESPQVILIKNRECIFDASHFDISVSEIRESLSYYEKNPQHL